MTDMEFGLLGPLVVRSGGAPVPMPRGHQRTVLAVLLLDANGVVTVDQIAEAVWGAGPPPSAGVTVRNLIRRLRQTLGDAGKNRITARPRGYQIRAGPGELDLARFEALAAAAREAARGRCWDEAAKQAAAALGLWRGEPLAGVESETLAVREVPRLAEMRWQVLQTRIDSDLHLGQQSLYREIGSPLGEVDALNSLGELLAATGQPDHARAEYAAALALAAQIGDTYQQARALRGLGQAYHADGDTGHARHHWQQALALFTEIGTPEAQQVRAQLAAARDDSHRTQETSR